jgi:hypothetical protein
MDVRYMNGVWLCRFYENGNGEKLLRQATFARPEKLIETVKRGKGMTFELGRRRANYAWNNCCGGQFWLQLTEEQSMRLRRF